MTAKAMKMKMTKPPDDNDPGALLCGHEHRIHYLGGGIWVCFACWAKALLGGGRKRQENP
jgi:hypothetical protein